MTDNFTHTTPPRGRTHVRTAICAATALAALWPILFVSHFGSVSALLFAARGGPTYAVIHKDFPDGRYFPAPGHDGQQFYAIARDPFHLTRTARYLDPPVRRYRRILFPLVARLLSPINGNPLVIALAITSIIGVLVGSLALTKFPGAPWWLPLTIPLSPGIMVALYMSLSDALSTGLVLAAFACAFRRRWWATGIVLAFAVLTRETNLVAVLCLVCWPNVDWRSRAKVFLPPIIAFGAWSVVVTKALGSSTATAAPGEFALPLTGWLHGVSGIDLVLPAALTLILILAAVLPGLIVPVRTFLVATAAMMLCLGPVINFSWVDSTRVLAPALPIAVWALTRNRSNAAGSADDA